MADCSDTKLVADGDVFEYEVRGIAPGKTAIVNLTVKRLFASEDGEYVAELSGSVLASRIHRETENEDCWECHDNQYRARMPNGRDYYVLKKDRENVTLARLTINFTDSETRMLGIGKSWDLGSGYVLHVADVNQRRGSARLQLYRDGRLLEDMIVNTGEYFTYEEWVLGRKIDLVRARLESCLHR
ncbi:Cytochrome c7 c [Candidatus Methanoperedenaceae archaeon GB50]|nr:Cytochrome c7 c [Candidatus Methanoperedenaceae archaeon GB50]